MASRFPMANSPGESTSQPRSAQSVWPTDATRSRSSCLATESSDPTVNSPAMAVVWTASGGCWNLESTRGAIDRGNAFRSAALNEKKPDRLFHGER